jgi:hypothetical protein
MSAPVCRQTDDRAIELGTGVSRPLAAVAMGLGLLVLSAPIALCLFCGPRLGTDNGKAILQRNAATQRANDIAMPAPVEGIRVIAAASSGQAAPEAPEPVWLAPEPPAIQMPELLTPPAKPVASASQPTVVLVPTTAAVAVPIPATLELATATRPPSAYESAAEAKQTPWPFKRRFPFPDEDLRFLLDSVAREVDLETEKGTTAKLLEKPKAVTDTRVDKDTGPAPTKSEPILDLLARRDDLKGLPLRNRAECQVGAKEAMAMQRVSTDLRGEQLLRSRSSDPIADLSYATNKRDTALVKFLEKRGDDWRDDASVRIVAQMIQPENQVVRLQLVKLLAASKGKGAGMALVQRAVFDLSAEVREAAVKALKVRPREETRPVLLEALRYPWSPVADHAAEALVALDDRDAALDLALLLDNPDPAAPTQDKDKKWVVPELVRVNHLGNCLLCHAPSSDKADPVRGVVPERGKPLPPAYYESRRGDFVRADITYIRQDFSVMQLVPEPDKWPQLQRFDYLVRKRELSADEVARLVRRPEQQPTSYPQREAVLWALRQLTGEDAGDKSEDWYELLVPGCYMDEGL